MNKRIKELVKQAQEYAGQQIDEGANWDDAPIYYTEKLTELIVRECGRVYIQNQQDGVMTLTEDLLYHFGVKE